MEKLNKSCLEEVFSCLSEDVIKSSICKKWYVLLSLFIYFLLSRCSFYCFLSNCQNQTSTDERLPQVFVLTSVQSVFFFFRARTIFTVNADPSRAECEYYRNVCFLHSPKWGGMLYFPQPLTHLIQSTFTATSSQGPLSNLASLQLLSRNK